jgi:peptidoglycan/LPS O-acetylase OafA/YrhL
MFGSVVLRSSYLAVDLFFVLSGFVIAHAYEGRLRSGLPVTTFMAIRLIRLYPLYLLGTALGIGLAAAQIMFGQELLWTRQSLLMAALFALFFLPTPKQYSPEADTFPLNGPAWSLFFELAINLVYALIARHLTDSRLTTTIAVSALLLLATGIHFGSLDVGFAWENIWGGGGRVCFSFFAGVMAYRIWLKKRPKAQIPFWLLAPAILLIFAIRLPDGYRAAFDLAAALVVFPLLVYACAAAEAKGRTAALYGVLGAASYGIYALHWPLTRFVQRFWAKVVPVDMVEFAPWLGFGFAAVVVVGVLIVDRYYDRPLRRLLLALVQPSGKRSLAAR